MRYIVKPGQFWKFFKHTHTHNCSVLQGSRRMGGGKRGERAAIKAACTHDGWQGRGHKREDEEGAHKRINKGRGSLEEARGRGERKTIFRSCKNMRPWRGDEEAHTRHWHPP